MSERVVDNWVTRWPRLVASTEAVKTYRKLYETDWQQNRQALKNFKGKSDHMLVSRGPFTGKTVAQARAELDKVRDEILSQKHQLEVEIRALIEKGVAESAETATTCNRSALNQLKTIMTAATAATADLVQQQHSLQSITDAAAEEPLADVQAELPDASVEVPGLLLS